jgi:hypothetical protein
MTRSQLARLELVSLGRLQYVVGALTSAALSLPLWFDFSRTCLITASMLGLAGIVAQTLLDKRAVRIIEADLAALHEEYEAEEA